jgi:hypothetical protein
VRFLNDYGMPGMQLVCLLRLLVSNPPTALLAAANTPCGRLGGIQALYNSSEAYTNKSESTKVR